VRALVLGALLALGWPALAQDAPSGHVEELDVDGDGVISRAEFRVRMAHAFIALDADDDDRLSPEDLAVVLAPDAFAALDTDADGFVSRAEFDARTRADFAAADLDASGALEPAE
jgi:Ca2+-binding EF-hand superfamily protein